MQDTAIAIYIFIGSLGLNACSLSKVFAGTGIKYCSRGIDNYARAARIYTVGYSSLNVTALGSDTWYQEWHVACESPHFFQFLGIGGTDNEHDITVGVPLRGCFMGNCLIEGLAIT